MEKYMSGKGFQTSVFSCVCGEFKCDKNDCPPANELLYFNIFDEFDHKMELLGRYIMMINNEVQKVLVKGTSKAKYNELLRFTYLNEEATDLLDITENIKEAGNYASVVDMERKIKRLAAEVLNYQCHHFSDLDFNTLDFKTQMDW